MTKGKRTMRAVSPRFAAWLDNTKRERIINGTDKKFVSDLRLTDAMAKDPDMDIIKRKLVRMPRKETMNRKGNMNNIMAIMVGIIIFIGLGFIFVLISAVWVDAFSTITNSLVDIQNPSGANGSNISKFAEITFGNLNEAFQQLRWISFMFIFGLMIGVVASAFIVRSHPAWFGPYILLSIVSIVLSIIIGSTYETLLNSSGALGASLQSFVGASFLMLHIEVWTVVITFVGAIIIFTQIGRDAEQGSFVG